jgi:hypothetical protein
VKWDEISEQPGQSVLIEYQEPEDQLNVTEGVADSGGEEARL